MADRVIAQQVSDVKSTLFNELQQVNAIVTLPKEPIGGTACLWLRSGREHWRSNAAKQSQHQQVPMLAERAKKLDLAIARY